MTSCVVIVFAPIAAAAVLWCRLFLRAVDRWTRRHQHPAPAVVAPRVVVHTTTLPAPSTVLTISPVGLTPCSRRSSFFGLSAQPLAGAGGSRAGEPESRPAPHGSHTRP